MNNYWDVRNNLIKMAEELRRLERVARKGVAEVTLMACKETFEELSAEQKQSIIKIAQGLTNKGGKND